MMLFDGKQIAQEYEALKNEPNNPEVLAAYRQFAHEIELQFESLPIDVEFTNSNPYNTSAEMFADIEQNNRLKVFRGGTPHALMPRYINKQFRAVHDYFGHYLGRNNFSYSGETKAFILHCAMFSPLAVRALFTETIGQNSWFNFSDVNRDKPNSEKQFAQQKAGLLI